MAFGTPRGWGNGAFATSIWHPARCCFWGVAHGRTIVPTRSNPKKHRLWQFPVLKCPQHLLENWPQAVQSSQNFYITSFSKSSIDSSKNISRSKNIMIHIIWFHDVLWSSPVQKLQATHELCPASTASRTLALAPCESSRLLGPPGASPKESPGGFVAAPTLRPGQKLGVWAAKIRAQCWAAKVGGLKTNKNHGIFQFPTNMSLIWDFGIYDWRKRCNNWNVINLNNETCAHQKMWPKWGNKECI